MDALKLPHEHDIAVIIVHGWIAERTATADPDYLAQIGKRARDTGRADVDFLHWEEAAGALPVESGFWNESGLGPKRSHAVRLGKCLGEALAGYKYVHLIGHSLGSWVIDAASDQLTPKGVNTHLTFFDAYVPNSGYAGSLGDRATYAEQFVSRPCGGWVIHTNEVLPEAHNFDVTDKNHQALLAEEHGWPIEWYASSTSPGFNDSWEANGFKGHDKYPQHAPVDYLEDPQCPGRTSELPADSIPQVGGLAVRAGDGSIRLQAKSSSGGAQRLTERLTAAVSDQSSESSSTVALRLPLRSLGVSAQVSVGVVGEGGGSVEIRLGSGQPVTVNFGTEGLQGDLFAMAGGIRAESEVQLTLRATGNAVVTAQFTTITAYGAGGGTAPLPPNTGNVARVAAPTSDGDIFKAAVLVAIFVGLGAGRLLALRRG